MILKPTRERVLAMTVAMYAIAVVVLVTPTELFLAVFPLCVAGEASLMVLTLRMRRQLLRERLAGRSRRDLPG